MKKPVKILLVLVALLVVAGIVVALSLNSIVKKGVETVGPQVTKTSLTLDGVNLSPLSGAGGIKGLVIGNPTGFKTEYAIKLGSASLAVDPKSLLSDKIVIRSLKVEGPEVTLEGGLKENNLTKILENIQAFTASEAKGEGAKTASGKPAKKLQVDEMVITGTKVNVALSMLGGKGASVTLPDIKFASLGTGPDGITIGDLSTKVFNEILKDTTTAATGVVSDLGKGVTDAAKGATDAVGKSTKGIGDLFKKK